MGEINYPEETPETSQQVLESYLEEQISEYSEMCDTLRTYYNQNLEKIKTCKTDVKIMKSREDSSFALLSPISIESSFQVEISQALEKQELLEKQNEKYMRDIRFYEDKIREMEAQLRKAREQEEPPMPREAPVSSEDQNERSTAETAKPAPQQPQESYNGNLQEDLERLRQSVQKILSFARLDPRRTAMELNEVQNHIIHMIGRLSSQADPRMTSQAAPQTASQMESQAEFRTERESEMRIQNEQEPEMPMPHSSYLSDKAVSTVAPLIEPVAPQQPAASQPPITPQQPVAPRSSVTPQQPVVPRSSVAPQQPAVGPVDEQPREPQGARQEDPEDAFLWVQASDISDVFEEYVGSYEKISAKRTDYYYEDDTDIDVPKEVANQFVLISQKFYKYLLNYANCSYIQFRLQCYENLLVSLFEWTSDDAEKDMNDTMEWRALKNEAAKAGLDVNRNRFDNDVIRITLTCNVKEAEI